MDGSVISLDDAAADHEIALEEDCRLTSCDVTLRRIKLDLNLILANWRDQCLSLFRRITDLHLRTKRLGWTSFAV